MSTASYQYFTYFTIDQALADLRVFIEAMNKKYFSDIAKPRWLLFGGSYPGSLSAWLREKNPDITIGAISSSCAVNTITDYWGLFRLILGF
ncbi:unnamed protein product [Anisakis simplex]|uniref:Putative serine protease (inferred by orthology to a C. elegans protein) n=1 Tax=Anisakis simplex TaxID=6269 RepID=A0A0M3KKB0_ANISI|nr:unnamed protein product [Anisakis simplex]